MSVKPLTRSQVLAQELKERFDEFGVLPVRADAFEFKKARFVRDVRTKIDELKSFDPGTAYMFEMMLAANERAYQKIDSLYKCAKDNLGYFKSNIVLELNYIMSRSTSPDVNLDFDFLHGLVEKYDDSIDIYNYVASLLQDFGYFYLADEVLERGNKLANPILESERLGNRKVLGFLERYGVSEVSIINYRNTVRDFLIKEGLGRASGSMYILPDFDGDSVLVTTVNTGLPAEINEDMEDDFTDFMIDSDISSYLLSLTSVHFVTEEKYD